MNKLLLPIYLVLLFCLITSSDVHAQKKKKKNKAENTTETSDPEKSAYYFIEGEKYFILEDFAKAYVFFQKALENDDQNAAAHFKLAEILMQTEELEKALSHAQKALELDPLNKYYHLINAEVYTKQSNFETAASIYKNMLSTVPDTEAYLFDLAALYLYQNDLKNALAIYDEAELEFGINPDIVMQKQKIYLKLNMLDEAIKESEKLIEAYPGEEEFVLQLAEMLISNNRVSEATKHLNLLLEGNPKNAHARLLLAEVYKQNNQVEESNENLMIAFESTEIALEPKLQMMSNYISKLPDEKTSPLAESLAENIIKAHPDEASAYTISGDLYYTLGEKEKAIGFYLQSLEIDKSNFNIWQNILDMELSLNKLDSVIAHSGEALTYFPNQAALYYFNGTAHILKKNYKEAANALEQGKRFASGNNQLLSIFHGQLGDTYNSLKDYKKSDASYESALALDPNNSHVLNNYAYFLSLRKENLEKAKEMSAKLVNLHAEDPTFLDTHAWVLYTMKEYKEAKKFLEKAIEKTNSGTIVEHYGDVLFKLGEVDKALIQWKKAQGMDDTSEFLDKKIAEKKLYE
jgi:tetratricopeptide (TPR) repeat protein